MNPRALPTEDCAMAVPLSESVKGSHSVCVSNDELVSVRDAMRGLNRMVEQLQNGERDQFVLLHRGRMVARVVPIQALMPVLERAAPIEEA